MKKSIFIILFIILMLVLPTVNAGMATYRKVPFLIVGRHSEISEQFDIELRVKNKQLVYGNLWIHKGNRHDTGNLIVYIGRHNSYKCNDMHMTIYNMISYLKLTEKYIFCFGYAVKIVIE